MLLVSVVESWYFVFISQKIACDFRSKIQNKKDAWKTNSLN